MFYDIFNLLAWEPSVLHHLGLKIGQLSYKCPLTEKGALATKEYFQYGPRFISDNTFTCVCEIVYTIFLIINTVWNEVATCLSLLDSLDSLRSWAKYS